MNTGNIEKVDRELTGDAVENSQASLETQECTRENPFGPAFGCASLSLDFKDTCHVCYPRDIENPW